MFRFVLICYILLCSSQIFGQSKTVVRDSVSSLFDQIRTADDSQKVIAAARLELLLETYYSDPANFDVELDSLPFLGQLSSWDGVVRMLCWNIAFENGSFKYHCVMRHRPGKETVAVTVFEHSDQDWNRINNKLIRPNDWYGALYYKLLTHRYRGQTYYTVLGWDGKDNITNRKVIDVIGFQGKNVILGSSLFRDENDRPVQRLIYEYANDVSMALNYDEQEKMIVMDHLAPEDSRFEGQFQFYGPDFSYDGLVFKKGSWQLLRDVFAKNRSLNNLPSDTKPGEFSD